MFANRLSRVLLSLLAVLATMAACETAHAEQPTPVIRTFGFLTHPELIPDYQSEDSIALTVLPDFRGPASEIAFSSLDTNPDGLFNGSYWVEAPAHHSTIGGAKDEGTRFWLIYDQTPTLPPFGAHTFIGPNSPLILFHKTYYIIKCSNDGEGCDPGEDSKYKFTTAPIGAPFLVVAAWFSR